MSDCLIPTGICWWGCGEEALPGSFVKAGHNKTAESGVIMAEYGGVPEFLRAHGFGPRSKNTHQALEEWRAARIAKVLVPAGRVSRDGIDITDERLTAHPDMSRLIDRDRRE